MVHRNHVLVAAIVVVAAVAIGALCDGDPASPDRLLIVAAFAESALFAAFHWPPAVRRS